MQSSIHTEGRKFHSLTDVEALEQKSKILLIEDEVLFARAVSKRLQKAGYDCAHVETVADGRTIQRQFQPDLVLLDMRLPDGNGLDYLPELVEQGISVIVMTAHGDLSDAVAAMKSGAVDYLKKPMDLDELLLIIQKAEVSLHMRHRLDYSRQRNALQVEGVEMLGNSPAMQMVRSQIERIAQLISNDQTGPNVLIDGETGTGKDVAARLLHQSSSQKERPFVHVDCASLPTDLIETELFGHEKGAFTSAQGARAGLIEAAEDGTLFLDEIGELPLTLQAKLLNVLERRVVRRVGSTRERPVNARIMAATNRDLQRMVAQGSFRSDLYYRLNVLALHMPPLRERGDDIMLLAQHFTEQTERRYGLARHRFAEDAQSALLGYGWPGNVRELRHQISRTILLIKDQTVYAQDLQLPGQTALQQQALQIPQAQLHMQSLALTHGVRNPEAYGQTYPAMSAPAQPTAAMTLDIAEKMLIQNALQETHFNVSEAARKLGITRMAMRYRMEKHGIKW